MVQCTQCNSELDEDFGLVTCQNCGAQLLIEMDGQVVDASSSQPEGQSSLDVNELETSDNVAFSANKELTQNMLSDLESESNQLDSFQDFNNFQIDEPEESEESHQPNEAAEYRGDEQQIDEPEPQALDNFLEFDNSEENIDTALDNQEVAESEDEPEPVTINAQWPDHSNVGESQNSANVMQEIQEYANSEESALDQGPLLYDLRIQGIDTKELRNQVLEHLSDSQLGIEAEQLKIDQGCLILDSLNPVITSVIVQRIKALPVIVDWRQHAAYS